MFTHTTMAVINKNTYDLKTFHGSLRKEYDLTDILSINIGNRLS
jgi:hypothetical protein